MPHPTSRILSPDLSAVVEGHVLRHGAPTSVVPVSVEAVPAVPVPVVLAPLLGDNGALSLVIDSPPAPGSHAWCWCAAWPVKSMLVSMEYPLSLGLAEQFEDGVSNPGCGHVVPLQSWLSWEPYWSQPTSSIPIRLKRFPGSNPASAIISVTALPKPPTTVCSSTVTKAGTSVAVIQDGRQPSRGLMVCTWSTFTPTPRAVTESAACTASLSVMPVGDDEGIPAIAQWRWRCRSERASHLC